MFEMKCPTCGAPVVVDNSVGIDGKFEYYRFSCTICEHESEFAIRSIQHEPEH